MQSPAFRPLPRIWRPFSLDGDKRPPSRRGYLTNRGERPEVNKFGLTPFDRNGRLETKVVAGEFDPTAEASVVDLIKGGP